MTHTRMLSAIVAVIMVVGAVGAAGSARAQTPFAVQSVGQRLADGDARMLGRGGWGLAESDTLHPGFKNPASAAGVRQVGLALTGYGESAGNESANTSRSTYRTYVPDARIVVPVIKGELAFSAGFKLERGTAWHTKVDSTWSVWDNTVTGSTQFEREGSTFKVPLGLAWRAHEALAAGITLNLERGSLRETLAAYYDNPVNASGIPFYRSVIGVAEDQFTGTSATLALLATPFRDWRVGVTWTGEHAIDGRRKTELGGVAERTFTDFELQRPAELSVGLAAGLGERWEVGLDLRRQDWRRFVAPPAWLARPGWQDELVDELQLGAGIERRRGTVRRAGWANLPLRVGVGLHRWPYQVGGNEVLERSVSVGTGFPLSGDRGTLDVGLTLGRIGDRQDNGLTSTYLRLAVSVTGLEAWW
ncbi:MAG: hypothetical protein IPK64_11515 [bacterium]|nr:hypothetical protein [bacterium]